jgi:Mn2+/Fe2+ NRAMP family transporter
LIPDDLPSSHTTLVVGFEFDASGNDIGAVFATASISPASAVPTLGLAGFALFACVLCACGWSILRRSRSPEQS